ncbi:hypothetical protein PAP18089_01927 [Pandoraea apista]|uniref:Uncharacterized protein n=1 Tax=Pandoraea apista TaxID=93218 RepID=A0A5E5P3U2_9BURK|nr:hypothetical protein [Pandoraea apista]VVG70955.1 hypothetical protein PAP18089_01927 [Pandoraea apista]
MRHAELGIESIKVVPAAPVPMMTLMGYSVADWASAATLLYVVMLACHYIYKNFIKPSGKEE